MRCIILKLNVMLSLLYYRWTLNSFKFYIPNRLCTFRAFVAILRGLQVHAHLPVEPRQMHVKGKASADP